MPTFYQDDVEISVDDFLNACDTSETKELIEALVEDGYLPAYSDRANQSAPEQLFETALVKLHNNWNRLTIEEEDTIMKISNRL